jgi:hypothetical protein
MRITNKTVIVNMSWSAEEEKLLHGGVLRFNRLLTEDPARGWKEISTMINDERKSPNECQLYWQEVCSRGVMKGNWCLEEDAVILNSIKAVRTNYILLSSLLTLFLGYY